jgi:hypothetical protein
MSTRKSPPNILAAARITRVLNDFPKETRRSILEFVLRCEEEAPSDSGKTEPQLSLPS